MNNIINNIIYYLFPVNIIFIVIFLVYIFDIKNENSIKKYDFSTYDIINIFLCISLTLFFLIIFENFILKIINK